MAKLLSSSGFWGVFGALAMVLYAVVNLSGTVLLQFGMATNTARYLTAVLYLPAAFGLAAFMWPKTRFWAALYLALVVWGTSLYIYEVATQSRFIRDYTTVAISVRCSQLVLPFSVMALGMGMYRSMGVAKLVPAFAIAYACIWLSLSAFSEQPWILNPLALLEGITGFALTVVIVWLFLTKGLKQLKS